jgi:hypothetical protein
MLSAAYSYDRRFMDYTSRISASSARAVSALVQTLFPIHSVLDVGCAQGVWLNAWHASGVADILGIDGEYVDQSALMFDRSLFRRHDLTNAFDLGRRFDLVESLEVGEHLPEKSAEGLVASLALHGDAVLFSAAPPGQGGEHHINEQPYEYWRGLFRKHGLFPVDFVRDAVSQNAEVAPWYRYNVLLYVNDDGFARLPVFAREFRVPDNQLLRDVSPARYRFRKAVIRLLPYAATQMLARLNSRL